MNWWQLSPRKNMLKKIHCDLKKGIEFLMLIILQSGNKTSSLWLQFRWMCSASKLLMDVPIGDRSETLSHLSCQQTNKQTNK